MTSLFHVPASEPSADGNRPLDEVTGTLERITFHNEENGYTVARIKPEGKRDVITILGNFAHPVVGETYVCFGHWSTHPQWGSQMSVVRHETVRPATVAAIEKYLGSGMVKGVGPVTAKRIVTIFGERSLDVIEKSPDELLQVPGLGAKTLAVIKSAWREQSAVRNVMVFLQSHDISPTFAAKIFRKYQGQSIEVVENNPYQLATDLWGVGFKTADKIAVSLGFAPDDQRRLQAGLVYVLSQAVETGGNVYLTRDELVRESGIVLGEYNVDLALDAFIASGRLIQEEATAGNMPERAIYTPELYTAEKSLAARLINIMKRPVAPTTITRTALLSAQKSPPLSDEQWEAVNTALNSRVTAITGGPGVGKTTTTNAIVRAFQQMGKVVLLASPTGRAAKRLSEVTGEAATTVHRLLAFDPQNSLFQRNSSSPIECDVLLVDESSMLDTTLTNSLVIALPDTAQLVFVGDIDQLPSVGPGNVLRDIIQCGAVPVARLTKIYRQASSSMIISGAHAINDGKTPRLESPRNPDADFVFIEEDDAEQIAGKIVAIVTRSLVKRGFSVSDVQVLSPMQRGSAGSAYLNERLQFAINPPGPNKPELQRSDRIFRQGDRVIQMRNNYEKLVYNGDIGTVTLVDSHELTINVSFDGRDVFYEVADLDELSLAYSLSIHKSQGSEFPATVIAFHTQHYSMLQRNLIYTALTRARNMAVLVGSRKALAIAVANDKQSTRHTRLKQRLMKLV